MDIVIDHVRESAGSFRLAAADRQSTSFFHLDYSRINEETFGHPFVLRSCLRG